jgi:hypothetical protein
LVQSDSVVSVSWAATRSKWAGFRPTRSLLREILAEQLITNPSARKQKKNGKTQLAIRGSGTAL